MSIENPESLPETLLVESSIFEHYMGVIVDTTQCSEDFLQDINWYLGACWLAITIREDVKSALQDFPVYGPFSTGLKLVSDKPMGKFWKQTREVSAGKTVWTPDKAFILGKWLANLADLLPTHPPAEALGEILINYEIMGTKKEPAPQMKTMQDGRLAFILPKHNKKFSMPGVSRDNSVFSLWKGENAVD